MNRNLILILLMVLTFVCGVHAKKKPTNSFETDTTTLVVIEEVVNDVLVLDSIVEERPEEVYDSITYTIRPSIMHIPVEINVALVEKMINEEFSGMLYVDNDVKDDSLMLKAWKMEDFKIQYENNELIYKIPVKLWIKKRIGLGFTHIDRELEGSININMKTRLGFSKDWGIVSNTQVIGYSWIEKPTIKLANMSVPITFIVEKILDKNKNAIGKMVDDNVNDFIPLKEYILDLWNTVQEPIEVNMEGYRAWIRTTPQQIYTTPIVGEYGMLRTTVGIRSLMEVFMGKAPRRMEKVTELPPFKQYKSTDENMLIHLLADIPYELLDSVAKSILLNETFGEGKQQIQVKDIEVYGHETELIIGLQVDGFVKGKIFLYGVPYYDKELGEIRVRDVDYKMNTKNVLAKVVNAFYKKGLKRKLEEELRFSLREEFEFIKGMSRSEMFDKELMKNVRLNGYIDKLDVDQLFLTETGIKVDMSIGGKMRVGMH